MDMLHQLDSVARFIFNNALVVFAIIWLHEGTRILAIGQQQRRGIKLLAPGILLLVLMVALQFWVSRTMGNLAEAMAKSVQTELPANWGANLDSENREHSSLAYASTVFTQSGKLVHFYDRSGELKSFCPTEKDIALRDQTITALSNLQYVGENAKSSVFSWLVFGCVSALVGWLTGRKERKPLGNPPDDQSA